MANKGFQNTHSTFAVQKPRPSWNLFVAFFNILYQTGNYLLNPFLPNILFWSFAFLILLREVKREHRKNCIKQYMNMLNLINIDLVCTQNFLKTIIYYSLIRTLTWAYQGVRNAGISEYFAYVLNEWSQRWASWINNDIGNLCSTLIHFCY